MAFFNPRRYSGRVPPSGCPLPNHELLPPGQSGKGCTRLLTTLCRPDLCAAAIQADPTRHVSGRLEHYFVTVKLVVVVCVSEPLVPVIVSGNVARVVELTVCTESVEPLVVGLGLKVTVVPDG